jgi:acyl carrier protein
MQNLNIIMTLEEEFKIDIPMDCFKELSSVKTIVKYLENQKCT